VYGNNQGSEDINEYDTMIRDYIESEKDILKIDIHSEHQVIIYDLNGGIIRQIGLEGGSELFMPAILKPLIDRAEFLTLINGIYYYVCEKN
jgi:hypothetical protein